MVGPISISKAIKTGPASVILGLLLVVQAPAEAGTLQDQLETAVSAFGNGDYAAAYWQLESIEIDFGGEPEFKDRDFQASVLPVRAYAALMADRPTDALVYFDRLIRDFEPSSALWSFALYNVAIARSQAGALAAAADTFRAFQAAFPNTPEAALALLQEADLRNEIGETSAATGLLDGFYESAAAETLRMQARLRALQIAGESGDTERAREILFGTVWNASAMPDIAILSFAALDAGDLLLERGLYDDAIRAYRLTLPHGVLIARQRERLLAAEAELNRGSLFASNIWKSHSRQQIARLRRQLERLESMEDYTPGLYLRAGQAYLLGQRYREAAILFRTVAGDEAFGADIRAEAHYRWILALCESEKWTEARATAHGFLEAHPEHDLANSALFLIARAYQGEHLFEEAIEVLDSLIANFPNDPQAPRWYFTRGHSYCVLEQHPRARIDFEDALERFPKSHLAVQLALWRGLTFFFERDYDACLEALLTLKQTANGHPLYPEILYRIANVYYAQRGYESALNMTDALIEEFADHHRVSEAQALRGDSFMGLGELTKAAHAFRQVPPDAQLYDYAVFQAKKIYKALERYDLLRDHLQAYVDREDAGERPRVSEALYWIGWSLQQEGRTEAAFPLFEEALDRFGNDPDARAVGSILSAYANLYARHQRGSEQALPDFEVWLQAAREQSLGTGELTWFARLTRFSAERQRTSAGDATAEAMLLSIHRFVPIEQQDPESLAAIGVVLAERGYEMADDYFERILTDYPRRAERAAAFYGKALLAVEQTRLETARRWLIRFLEETPTHPLAPDARLLAARVLTDQGQFAAGQAALNEILQIKEMRGRPHARALAGLARIEMELENPKRAIPYWQRVYTLYRAYPELVVDAYWESALLFEAIGDPVAARNTVREMLKDDRLQAFDAYALAQEKLPELEAAAEAAQQLAQAIQSPVEPEAEQ